MVNPLLEVRNLAFGYGHQPLLYDLHMQVHSGEMLGLLGPNGSGKTTLLRLLSGILSPQQGQILLEGRDLRQWGRRSTAQRIAVVPQELHMPFAFTVEHMVSLGRTPFINFFGSQTKHDHSIVQDAMHAAGTTPLAKRIFNELSGGERQRVILAMALAQEPKLLLLDEPTTHLDIKYQIDILELIQGLNRDLGLAVIAAMHDLNLAARYFPRLVLFQHGIVADASPAEVLEPALLQRVYGVNVQVGILRGAEHLSILPPNNDAVSRRGGGGVDEGRGPLWSPAFRGAGAQPLPGFGVSPNNLLFSLAAAGGEQEEEAGGRGQRVLSHPPIHLIAGGGAGELTMRALADAHIPFTAGALNIGDSDHTLALRLATQVITEQPYAPISPEALQQVRTSLMYVHLLIICPVPIGTGNVALLQEALAAAQRGLPVLLLAPTVAHPASGEPVAVSDGIVRCTGVAWHDYTGGEGRILMDELLEAGALVVGSVTEVIETVKRCTGSTGHTPYPRAQAS